MPTKKIIYEVEGDSGNYDIDIEEMTCTCMHFFHRLKYFPIDDDRRKCKHIRKTINYLIKKNANNKKSNPLPAQTNLSKKGRISRERADNIVRLIENKIKHRHELTKFLFAGSYRRLASTVGDLDLLIAFSGNDNSRAENIFNDIQQLSEETLIRGTVKARFMVLGVQVDVMVADITSWPFATLHFTGSVYSNVRLRQRARSIGLSLSEYGFKDTNYGKPIPDIFGSEEEIYKFLDVKYVKPENR